MSELGDHFFVLECDSGVQVGPIKAPKLVLTDANRVTLAMAHLLDEEDRLVSIERGEVPMFERKAVDSETKEMVQREMVDPLLPIITGVCEFIESKKSVPEKEKAFAVRLNRVKDEISDPEVRVSKKVKIISSESIIESVMAYMNGTLDLS